MHELLATAVDLLFILAADKRLKRETQVRRPAWLRRARPAGPASGEPAAAVAGRGRGDAAGGDGSGRGRRVVATREGMDHAFGVILGSIRPM